MNILMPWGCVQKYDFIWIFWASRSCLVSEREKLEIRQKKPKWLAHLFFCAERPKRITHIRSFVMSDSLTVAHLSWANCSQLLFVLSKLLTFVLSEFPTLYPIQFKNTEMLKEFLLSFDSFFC